MLIPFGVFSAAGAGGGGGGGAGSYELIETQILTGTTATISLVSIPQTYKHLQLRFTARTNTYSTSQLRLRFNSDTATNYAIHTLYGNGSSVTSSANTSIAGVGYSYLADLGAPANAFGAGVVDILDYASTSKYTTVRTLGGEPSYAVAINLNSGLWKNTAAVSSIDFASSNGSLVAGTRVSLYGIKG